MLHYLMFTLPILKVGIYLKNRWYLIKSKSILKWLNIDKVKRDYSAYFKMADWELASFLLLHQILEMKEMKEMVMREQKELMR